MNLSSNIDVSKLMNIFYLRKRIILATFVVVSSLTVYLSVSLPDIYRSSTLILITPQKLPASYVSSPTAWSVEQRVRTISQDILSRRSLGKIVQELNLYPELGSVDARVEKLRKNMLIDVKRSDAFALSFEHRNPEKAMQVANRIGSLFVEENVNLREEQAEGTTNFINTEAETLRKELEAQESEVNLYKARHRYELPEQLEVNLRTLEQLRTGLQNNTSRLSSLQERKASLEKQLVEAKFAPVDSTSGQNVPAWQQLEVRTQQLEDLRTRYSEKHPDIVRLKGEIQMLQGEAKAQQAQLKNATSADAVVARNPLQQMLLKQIGELTSEINSLVSTNETNRGQIASYQARIENTPVRAIELTKITRAYDVTARKFQDLQSKSFDTRLSQRMEKSEKGEQFRLIDKANLPQQPVGPNRLRMVILGLVAAIVGSFGLALVRENLDSSFKGGEELRSHSNLPLLAIIPAIVTRGTILEQRRAQGILVLASGMVIVVGVVSIHFLGALFY